MASAGFITRWVLCRWVLVGFLEMDLLKGCRFCGVMEDGVVGS